jgi:anti-sigma B factor antagonist
MPAYDFFDVRSQDEGERVRVVVSGELDLATAAYLRRAVVQAWRHASRSLLLDLSALKYMDSAGIALVIDCIKFAHVNGHRFALAADIPEPVARVFEVSGLTPRLPIDET